MNASDEFTYINQSGDTVVVKVPPGKVLYKQDDPTGKVYFPGQKAGRSGIIIGRPNSQGHVWILDDYDNWERLYKEAWELRNNKKAKKEKTDEAIKEEELKEKEQGKQREEDKEGESKEEKEEEEEEEETERDVDEEKEEVLEEEEGEKEEKGEKEELEEKEEIEEEKVEEEEVEEREILEEILEEDEELRKDVVEENLEKVLESFEEVSSDDYLDWERTQFYDLYGEETAKKVEEQIKQAEKLKEKLSEDISNKDSEFRKFWADKEGAFEDLTSAQILLEDYLEKIKNHRNMTLKEVYEASLVLGRTIELLQHYYQAFERAKLLSGNGLSTFIGSQIEDFVKNTLYRDLVGKINNLSRCVSESEEIDTCFEKTSFVPDKRILDGTIFDRNEYTKIADKGIGLYKRYGLGLSSNEGIGNAASAGYVTGLEILRLARELADHRKVVGDKILLYVNGEDESKRVIYVVNKELFDLLKLLSDGGFKEKLDPAALRELAILLSRDTQVIIQNKFTQEKQEIEEVDEEGFLVSEQVSLMEYALRSLGFSVMDAERIFYHFFEEKGVYETSLMHGPNWTESLFWNARSKKLEEFSKFRKDLYQMIDGFGDLTIRASQFRKIKQQKDEEEIDKEEDDFDTDTSFLKAKKATSLDTISDVRKEIREVLETVLNEYGVSVGPGDTLEDIAIKLANANPADPIIVLPALFSDFLDTENSLIVKDKDNAVKSFVDLIARYLFRQLEKVYASHEEEDKKKLIEDILMMDLETALKRELELDLGRLKEIEGIDNTLNYLKEVHRTAINDLIKTIYDSLNSPLNEENVFGDTRAKTIRFLRDSLKVITTSEMLRKAMEIQESDEFVEDKEEILKLDVQITYDEIKALLAKQASERYKQALSEGVSENDFPLNYVKENFVTDLMQLFTPMNLQKVRQRGLVVHDVDFVKNARQKREEVEDVANQLSKLTNAQVSIDTDEHEFNSLRQNVGILLLELAKGNLNTSLAPVEIPVKINDEKYTFSVDFAENSEGEVEIVVSLKKGEEDVYSELISKDSEYALELADLPFKEEDEARNAIFNFVKRYIDSEREKVLERLKAEGDFPDTEIHDHSLGVDREKVPEEVVSPDSIVLVNDDRSTEIKSEKIVADTNALLGRILENSQKDLIFLRFSQNIEEDEKIDASLASHIRKSQIALKRNKDGTIDVFVGLYQDVGYGQVIPKGVYKTNVSIDDLRNLSTSTLIRSALNAFKGKLLKNDVPLGVASEAEQQIFESFVDVEEDLTEMDTGEKAYEQEQKQTLSEFVKGIKPNVKNVEGKIKEEKNIVFEDKKSRTSLRVQKGKKGKKIYTLEIATKDKKGKTKSEISVHVPQEAFDRFVGSKEISDAHEFLRNLALNLHKKTGVKEYYLDRSGEILEYKTKDNEVKRIRVDGEEIPEEPASENKGINSVYSWLIEQKDKEFSFSVPDVNEGKFIRNNSKEIIYQYKKGNKTKRVKLSEEDIKGRSEEEIVELLKSKIESSENKKTRRELIDEQVEVEPTREEVRVEPTREEAPREVKEEPEKTEEKQEEERQEVKEEAKKTPISLELDEGFSGLLGGNTDSINLRMKNGIYLVMKQTPKEVKLDIFDKGRFVQTLSLDKKYINDKFGGQFSSFVNGVFSYINNSLKGKLGGKVLSLDDLESYDIRKSQETKVEQDKKKGEEKPKEVQKIDISDKVNITSKKKAGRNIKVEFSVGGQSFKAEATYVPETREYILTTEYPQAVVEFKNEDELEDVIRNLANKWANEGFIKFEEQKNKEVRQEETRKTEIEKDDEDKKEEQTIEKEAGPKEETPTASNEEQEKEEIPKIDIESLKEAIMGVIDYEEESKEIDLGNGYKLSVNRDFVNGMDGATIKLLKDGKLISKYGVSVADSYYEDDFISAIIEKLRRIS